MTGQITYAARERLTHLQHIRDRCREAALAATARKNSILQEVAGARAELQALGRESFGSREARQAADEKAAALERRIAEITAEYPGAKAIADETSAEYQAAIRLFNACTKFARENRLPLPVAVVGDALDPEARMSVRGLRQ